MSTSSSQPSHSPDEAARQARFDAELQVAGIAVSDEDHGPLYAMWTELVPIRARLQTADLALEEEPSFTQKPAQIGAGIILVSLTPTHPPATNQTTGGPA